MLVRILTFLLLAAACSTPLPAGANGEQAADTPGPASEVLTGLDILEREGFARLRGLRVGVVTNHTAVDREGNHLIDLLLDSEEVELATVFAPEHGLEGLIEGDYDSARDRRTGLHVHSLYGDTRKPLPEWLEGLDLLLFDIQDIGARFYTYITTMALCMQAARDSDLRFMVLDRPNPVGGLKVEGPVLEEALCGNFIAYYPIPVRHGMTVGELAGLFNSEFGIGARLEVVPMENWRRGMYFDQTGLKWIDPSPNMRSLRAAILYPGLGISESTNLSVGRGTDTPFELYGAPYVDGGRLAARLESAGLPGVEFSDTTFTPVSHKFSGERCGGVRARVTDRRAFESVRAGLHLLRELEQLYPGTYELDNIDRWIGRREVKGQIEQGVTVEEIVAGWQEGLDRFMRTRAKYLLYGNGGQ